MVECAKQCMLRWFGQTVRMNENYFARKVFEGRIEGEGVRGRPLVK